MNAIEWTVKQLTKDTAMTRQQLIQQLYERADPGTFADLDSCSDHELRELWSIITDDEEAE
jgi:hypothetical protein